MREDYVVIKCLEQVSSFFISVPKIKSPSSIYWTILNSFSIFIMCPWNPLSKGDQSWVFIGRTNVEAETPILWPPDAKSWIIGKDLDSGKDWGQEEKGMTEDEMVRWHHWLNGHEFGWTPGVGDGQGGLVCCGSWGCKESDTTEWLNWTELNPLPFCGLE